MSSDLERRLDGFFAELPEPEAEVGERALGAALAAVHPSPSPRRGLRAGVLALATALVLLAIAAGSLAAAGALHVSFGSKVKPQRAITQLVLPHGAAGIAAVIDGKLSVVTKGGFRLQGLAVSSAALSPHALFVAAGIGHSLVAMAPNGRRAWSHGAGGTVVAIAWAPFGNRIAYVVQADRHFVLHVIWGNGTNDAAIDRSVRAVRPSWRADSLAVAYVGAGGHAIVYDVGHRSRSVVAATAPVTRVAFAPVGRALAIGSTGAVVLVSRGRDVAVAHGDVEVLGWQGTELDVALRQGSTPALVRTFAPSGRPLHGFRVPGRVVGTTGSFLVAQTHHGVLVGWLREPVTSVLTLKSTATVGDVGIG